MPETWTIDIVWWITAVEIPAVAGLYWLSWRNRRDVDTAIYQNRLSFEASLTRLREGLSAYKLEVAKSYASIAYIKELEKRITSHLLRIEDKLDAVSYRNGGGS